MTIQQIITYLEHNAYIVGEVTDACVEALKNQAVYEQILWERDIAIKQLEDIGLSFGEKTDKVKEALEKQAGIERALERLKKKEEEYLKEFRTRGYEELYGASWGFEEAIDIITEEVG